MYTSPPFFRAYAALPLLVSLAGTSPAISQSFSTRDLTIEQKQVADVVLPEADLKVAAWVDRKDETYTVGDAVQLFVKANRDSWITVIDVGTSGKVHVIFPNKHHPDNRVLAHQVLQIPGPDAPYRLRVGGPAGHELIKIIATTRADQVIRPDRLTESGAFYSYRGDVDSLTRDLKIELEDSGFDAGAASSNKVIRILGEGAALSPSADKPGSASGALSPEDLFRLGESSFYGDGGVPDYREALRFFMLAAEAGHVGAMTRVGRIHENGMDVDVDLAAALRWYRRAAELGGTTAMVRLALIHARDAGERRNYAEAVRWLKKAAGQGDGVALMALGRMHDEGIGVEREPREAARYLLDALRAGAWAVLDQIGRLSDETRREVQSRLRQFGHYRGPLDGQIGPETRAALVEFARVG